MSRIYLEWPGTGSDKSVRIYVDHIAAMTEEADGSVRLVVSGQNFCFQNITYAQMVKELAKAGEA